MLLLVMKNCQTLLLDRTGLHILIFYSPGLKSKSVQSDLKFPLTGYLESFDWMWNVITCLLWFCIHYAWWLSHNTCAMYQTNDKRNQNQSCFCTLFNQVTGIFCKFSDEFITFLHVHVLLLVREITHHYFGFGFGLMTLKRML